jgi:hypothetical protein
MYRSIRFISLVLVLMAVVSLVAMGQVQFKIPIRVTITGYATPDTVWIGVHGSTEAPILFANSYGPDVALSYGELTDWREAQYPASDPPTFHFVSKFLGIPNEPTTPPAGIPASGMRPNDFRGYTSPTQVDTFHLKVYGDGVTSEVANGPITLSWPNTLHFYGSAWVLKVKAGGNFNTVAVADMRSTLSYVDAATVANACEYYIIKTGATEPGPGPSISLSASTIAWGIIPAGTGVNNSITVNSTGITNPLNVTAVTMPNPAFTLVSPTLPISIPAQGSQLFTFRYTAPISGGTQSGNIAISSNAGADQLVAVSGTGQTQGGTLTFSTVTDTVLDNSAFLDTAFIGITGYAGDTVNGLQFTLVTNGQITMKPLVKIGNIAPDNWTMTTTTAYGTYAADNTRVTTVHVVLFANNGIGMSAAQIQGNANILKFAYSTANIGVPFTSTTVVLSAIKGAILKNHVSGNAKLIGTSADSTISTKTIVLKNRSTKGDVNGDGVVDILDLLALVDDVNSGTYQAALDVSPWPAGDGVLDIMDIVALQSIIMDGKYPDGSPLTKAAVATVAPLGKSAGTSSVTFYVTKTGIAVRCNSVADLKGLQIQLENIQTTSTLSAKSVKLQDGVLQALIYNMNGKNLEVGLAANFEMSIANPAAVTVTAIKGSNSSLEYAAIDKNIVLGNAPELPVAYALHQNYPNPFNPSTVIEFAVPQTSQVRVVVYNLLGQEVRTLFSGQMNRGTKAIAFDGKDASGKTLATGTYIYRIQAGSFTEVKKMLLLK